MTVSLIFSTADLPAHLRPHLTLYLATLFALPIKRQDGSGQQLSYEEVIKLLDEDTLEYDSSLGVGYGFAENICIDLKIEKANYEKAIGWLRDLVWGSEFSVERLKIVAAKLLQSLPEQKRDGRSVSVALLRSLTRDVERSSGAANTVIEQSRCLPEVTKMLSEEPNKVVEMFEQIRSTLFKPENIRASVAGDVLGLPKPRDSWRANFVNGWQPKDTLPVQWTRNVLTPLGKKPAKKVRVRSSYCPSSFQLTTLPSGTHMLPANYREQLCLFHCQGRTRLSASRQCGRGRRCFCAQRHGVLSLAFHTRSWTCVRSFYLERT